MIQLTIPVAASLLVAFLTLVFAFGRILLQQFEKRADERVQAQNALREQQIGELKRSIASDRAAVTELTGKFNEFTRELPLLYVRREDWIRFSATIDHKLDRLADMITERNIR